MWLGPRAKAGERRHRFGIGELEDLHAVLAIGDIAIEAGICHRHLDVVSVVELALGIECLIELWLLGLFDIDYGDAFFAVGYICVGASKIDAVGMVQGDGRSIHDADLALC